MLLHIDRKRFTWNFMMCNFKTKEVYSIYIQFSLTDPWWLPRYMPHYSKINIPLYGWLFFYFGRQTEGILYETEETDAKITDRKGQKYYLFTIKDRNIKDRVRQAVKHYAHFEVKVKLNDDGSKDLIIIFMGSGVSYTYRCSCAPNSVCIKYREIQMLDQKTLDKIKCPNCNRNYMNKYEGYDCTTDKTIRKIQCTSCGYWLASTKGSNGADLTSSNMYTLEFSLVSDEGEKFCGTKEEIHKAIDKYK